MDEIQAAYYCFDPRRYRFGEAWRAWGWRGLLRLGLARAVGQGPVTGAIALEPLRRPEQAPGFVTRAGAGPREDFLAAGLAHACWVTPPPPLGDGPSVWLELFSDPSEALWACVRVVRARGRAVEIDASVSSHVAGGRTLVTSSTPRVLSDPAQLETEVALGATPERLLEIHRARLCREEVGLVPQEELWGRYQELAEVEVAGMLQRGLLRPLSAEELDSLQGSGEPGGPGELDLSESVALARHDATGEDWSLALDGRLELAPPVGGVLRLTREEASTRLRLGGSLLRGLVLEGPDGPPESFCLNEEGYRLIRDWLGPPDEAEVRRELGVVAPIYLALGAGACLLRGWVAVELQHLPERSWGVHLMVALWLLAGAASRLLWPAQAGLLLQAFAATSFATLVVTTPAIMNPWVERSFVAAGLALALWKLAAWRRLRDRGSTASATPV